MSSKEFIINSIKEANLDKKTALPSLEDIEHTIYENPLKSFKESIKSVAGEVKEIRDMSIEEFLKENYPNDKKVVTTIENLCENCLHVSDFQDPHELKDVDLAIVKGEFAVAENGAVWIKEDISLRAIYFIAKKLIILIDKDEIVNSMHEAYERVEFEKSGFGVFISGPSKTADIEQSLVIGAHGAMECCVLLT